MSLTGASACFHTHNFSFLCVCTPSPQWSCAEWHTGSSQAYCKCEGTVVQNQVSWHKPAEFGNVARAALKRAPFRARTLVSSWLPVVETVEPRRYAHRRVCSARSPHTHQTVAKHGEVKRARDPPEFRTYLSTCFPCAGWSVGHVGRAVAARAGKTYFSFSSRWVPPSWTATLPVTPGLSARWQNS